MKKGVFTVVSSVLLSGLTAFAVAKAADLQKTDVMDVAYDADGEAVRTVNLSLSDYPDFTYAAEKCVDAVVFVKVTVKSQQKVIDPFEFFFGYGNGQPQTREKVQQGSGSGVIIRQDGYIVTNNHVVSGATSIEVTLNNNKTYEAKVIGTDPVTDVALIKVDAEGLPFLQFADSDDLRLGEWVLAIGSPLGEELRSTITAGIVSAKGRSTPNYDGQFKIESFIQTDAAVNPGNSGGALVNKEGQLVGINTMIVSPNGTFTGYSFAVPSNIVRKIVMDLIDFGSVKRVKLGVSISQVDEKTAKENKLSAPEGVLIHEVTKGGTADKAGIKDGDIIIAIDSTATKTPAQLQEKVNGYHPGEKANIRIIRNGKVMNLSAVFDAADDNSTGLVDEDGSVSFYGATLKEGKDGVEVVSAGNGKFAQAGGEDGFVIKFVNDQKVSKPQDVIDLAKKARRSIFIEGVNAAGRPGYFGFGKDE